MYFFNGSLKISPSQITHIKKVQPQKGFRKVLYFLTLGSVTDKLEQETFTAVSILQELYGVFASLGIDDLVRLSHDDQDLYLDTQGRKGNFKEVLENYCLQINEAMSSSFNHLNLVLEHTEGSFKYFINVIINRTHQIGEHPIEIVINGLIKDFKVDKNTRFKKDVKEKIRHIFDSQGVYDRFVLTKQAEFLNFIKNFRLRAYKLMQVRYIQAEYQYQIIAPKKEYQQDYVLQNYRSTSPIYHNHNGVDDMMFYSLTWASIMLENHIYKYNPYINLNNNNSNNWYYSGHSGNNLDNSNNWYYSGHSGNNLDNSNNWYDSGHSSNNFDNSNNWYDSGHSGNNLDNSNNWYDSGHSGSSFDGGGFDGGGWSD